MFPNKFDGLDLCKVINYLRENDYLNDDGLETAKTLLQDVNDGHSIEFEVTKDPDEEFTSFLSVKSFV